MSPGLGKGGTGVLSVDGKVVARNSMEHSTPITFPEDETFDIGRTRAPASRCWSTATTFRSSSPGTINKLTFDLGAEQVTAEERERMQKTVAGARD